MYDHLKRRVQRLEADNDDDRLKIVFCRPEDFDSAPNTIRLDPEDQYL